MKLVDDETCKESVPNHASRVGLGLRVGTCHWWGRCQPGGQGHSNCGETHVPTSYVDRPSCRGLAALHTCGEIAAADAGAPSKGGCP